MKVLPPLQASHLLAPLLQLGQFGMSGVESVVFSASHGDWERMKSRSGIELRDGRRVSEDFGNEGSFAFRVFRHGWNNRAPLLMRWLCQRTVILTT